MTNAAHTRNESDSDDTVTYRGPAHSGAPRLADLDGVDTVDVVEDGDRDVLEHERFDTADLRLAGAGIVLAVARHGDSAHWELRLPDSRPDERLRVPSRPRTSRGSTPTRCPRRSTR